MRLMVFFDLPVESPIQRKRYAQFRKFLIKEGYLMMQQSVYSKLVINKAAAVGAIGRLTKHRPLEGLVQVLEVTEKQYAMMACITGREIEHAELETSDELVIL